MNPHRFTGTAFIIIFLLSFLVPTVTNGQCYQIARSSGVKALDAKKYDEAIKKFEAAKQCSDVPAGHDLDVLIKNAQKAKAATRTSEKRTTTPPRKNDTASRPIELEMVFVQGGTFQMGCRDGHDIDCTNSEKPAHLVTVKDFYIGKYEVTFEEYDAFCNATGRTKPLDEGWGRGKRPVINVSWEDAIAYCKWLSKQTGKNYRLPTEAEWEYAARGGAKSRGFKYAGSNNIDDVVWYYGNSGAKTRPVGQKRANELGIYDMNGNVSEWVQDCWHDNYTGAPTDGSAWVSGKCYDRVLRGASWINPNYCCSIVSRDFKIPHVGIYNDGFRLAQDR